MDRECGGGERNFHISRPGERLRPRAINGRGRGSTRWSSAGLRPPAAPAAPDPRANSWVSLPSLLQAQPASQLPLPLRAPGVARLPSVHPSTPSPSSSRWMMLSMLSLSISAIAFPPPTLPQRRHRRLAPGIHTSLPTPRAEAVVAAVAAAAAGNPPNRAAACFLLLSLLEPREEQNGRRLLSQLWAAQGCARGSTAALPGLLYGP